MSSTALPIVFLARHGETAWTVSRQHTGATDLEVPVGFKWFVPGLFDGSCCFGGEESAGASFLRHDGTVWTTDKDGPIMDLLAAEITARTGKDPGEHYQELVAEFGASHYTRIDAPATPEQKARLQKLSPDAVKEETLAGEQITAKLTRAPGNDAPIDGLKIVTPGGWFAARPSGTEDIYKIYAESFRSAAHLDALVSEAQTLVDAAVERSPMRLPPFPAGYRASGLLLHVTSLPSPYGIGDVGPAADGVDRPASRGRTALVAGVAAGPDRLRRFAVPVALFVRRQPAPDQPRLADRGRAGEAERWRSPRRFRPTAVDFEAVKTLQVRHARDGLEELQGRRALGSAPGLRALRPAASATGWTITRCSARSRPDTTAPRYLEWPEELVRRTPAALERARRELASQVDRVRFAQFLLFRQGARLKAHARAKGVALIGDLPFFVSPDSSDVWAHPELFLLDATHRPRVVAGVPPDYFSAQGQRWGNPVYDWDALASRGYRWCIDRVRALLAHVDAIRLDHFRGFAAAWHIPAWAPTAQAGRWVRPGAGFFAAVEKALGGLPFIAEDLGLITPDVGALRDAFRFRDARAAVRVRWPRRQPVSAR